MHHLRCPIQDVSITDTATLHRILDHIDVALSGEGTVYVHCWGGIGRTGMVAGALLVRRGLPPSGALHVVNAAWRGTAKAQLAKYATRTSPETVEQMRVVAEWEGAEIARATARGETRLRVIDLNAPALPKALRPVDPREAERRDRARGCLLGGAVGDALGWPVEFMKLPEIRKKYGPKGITELQVDPRTAVAEVTDDTQMTLFTAEGVLRGICRGNHRGIGGPESTMRQAYRRWLLTQEGLAHFRPTDEDELEMLVGKTLATHGLLSGASPSHENFGGDQSGWLIRVPALHARRAPGTTCLSALRALDYGADSPIAKNDSKGCGTVMRVAPIGLVHMASVEMVFDLACYAAGITHGHPTGILSAGVFAAVVRCVFDGATIADGVAEAQGLLRERSEDWAETDAAVSNALRLAKGRRVLSPALVAELGLGWVAEEALAIALLCGLRGEAGLGFENAVRAAVNHDGDSDSTGSMTGQVLGVRFGAGVIPDRWVAGVELREVVERVAGDLVTGFEEGEGWWGWWGRWPGW